MHSLLCLRPSRHQMVKNMKLPTMVERHAMAVSLITLCVKIAKATGSEARVTVLGHVQRGASPTYNDRLLASAFGVHAVDLLVEKKYGRMVAWQNDTIVDVPIEDAIKECHIVDVDGNACTYSAGHWAYLLGIDLVM